MVSWWSKGCLMCISMTVIKINFWSRSYKHHGLEILVTNMEIAHQTHNCILPAFTNPLNTEHAVLFIVFIKKTECYPITHSFMQPVPYLALTRMQKPLIISKSNNPHERNRSECNFVLLSNWILELWWPSCTVLRFICKSLMATLFSYSETKTSTIKMCSCQPLQLHSSKVGW